jgi:hypothetical protein
VPRLCALPVTIQRLLKYVAVGLAVTLGALAGVGCLLAALFEVQGFGGPRDQGPRTGYLVELAVAFVAAVLIPVLLWRRLLGGGPGLIVAGCVAIAGVLVILGLSFGF